MKKQYLLIVAILTLGLLVALAIIKTAPTPQKKTESSIAPLVETRILQKADSAPFWTGGATANANDSVELIAQVAGQLQWVNPKVRPGDFVKKGTILARVEKTDYELQVQQMRAALVQAQANLDIELGQVENARSDYRLSGIELQPAAKALALRKPQLASANASLNMAQADLKKAELNLSRTNIVMPFDGHVLKQMAFTGTYLTSATPLFSVIDSQSFWLEVSVPNSFLAIIDKNHAAEVNSLGDVRTRSANVLNISPAVSESDRQAQVLLAISDPLEAKENAPIIRYNDYVEVTLFAEQKENVYQVPSDKVDAGKIWVVDQQNTLQTLAFKLVYKGREQSWVQFNAENIQGYQMLVSELSNKQRGLAVRVKNPLGAQ